MSIGQVDDKVCEKCYNTGDIPSDNVVNNVVGSILFKECLKIIKSDGTEFMSVDRANKLYDYLHEVKQTCSCNFDINRNLLREEVEVRDV